MTTAPRGSNSIFPPIIIVGRSRHFVKLIMTSEPFSGRKTLRFQRTLRVVSQSDPGSKERPVENPGGSPTALSGSRSRLTRINPIRTTDRSGPPPPP